MKEKVLIVSGHTDLNASVANRTIIDRLGQLLPEAEVVRLDERYPDFRIDAAAEQERLRAADVVVLQFPLFWYGAPSLLMRWIEQTFLHGFSHGSTGTALRGKRLVLSVTAGAPEEAYAPDGAAGAGIEDFLMGFRATCRLCGMVYAGCVFTGGVSYGMRTNPEQIDEQRRRSEAHAGRLAALIGRIAHR
ncbi:MAG: NAD(P)H-dependent oxidoreductase [Prevotellaceae bacterium]|nr:NAD(P)H-dependent oxidoreductase [Prevotellaceae bacterium]